MKYINHSKIFFWKKIMSVALSSIFSVATVSSVTTFSDYKNSLFNDPLNLQKNILINFKNHNNNNNNNNFNRPQIFKNIYGIKIIEYSLLKNHPLENTEFFLGDKGLEILIEKIKNRTGFGPEFFDLNEIILTQSGQLIGDLTNGWYHPVTRQIVLNISSIMNYFNHEWKNREHYLDDITEIIYQTFYHEYWHHVFNVYLANFDYDKNFNENLFIKFYRGNGKNRFYEPWNEAFINEFKTNLNYDKNTSLLDNVFVKNIEGQDITLQNGFKLKSIGSLYNPKMLFDRANELNEPQYDELDYEKLLNTKTFYSWVANITTKTNWAVLSGDYLSYVYQITELLTRKYMQLTFPFKYTNLISNHGILQSRFQDPKNTTYLTDLQMYQENFHSLSSHRFLDDAPLKDEITANNLIDLLHFQIGQKTIDNISYIWNQSDVKLIEKPNQIQLQINNLNVNKIKFGGFLDSSQSHYKYIGYFDNQYFRAIPIQVYDYDLNRIPYLGATYRQNLKSGAKKFYITNYHYTNDWIDLNFINNQKLFFATDNNGANAKPLKVAKKRKNPVPIWTKRFHNIYHKNHQNEYAMIKSNDYGLKIVKKLAQFS